MDTMVTIRKLKKILLCPAVSNKKLCPVVPVREELLNENSGFH